MKSLKEIQEITKKAEIENSIKEQEECLKKLENQIHPDIIKRIAEKIEETALLGKYQVDNINANNDIIKWLEFLGFKVATIIGSVPHSAVISIFWS